MVNGQISSEGIEVFISYSHKDELLRDELEKHLSILKRQKLILTWFDRKIGAGEEWKGQIDEHLDSAQVILLLISADFLASDYCYDVEMIRAMERHESGEARVIPIILRPVDWKDAPFGKLQARPTNAEPVISKSWGSIDEAFVDVARGLREAIGSFKPKDPASANSKTAPNGSLKNIIVDQMHRGEYTTINAAIAAAAPGSRILVHSGVYDEGLIIDKPLEIVGDGNLGDVIIRATGKSAILFKATRGKISNLTLRQNGGDSWSCVDITQGCLELVGCDISSDRGACVSVHGTAYPKIIGNRIHSGKYKGIYVYENGQGVIENNDIYGNAGPGVYICDKGNPIVKSNKIHDMKSSGVDVIDNGQGIIEENDIYGNVYAGIWISGGGNPIVKRNKIHNGESNGININENGLGVIEDNDIYGNAGGGIDIKSGGNPLVRFNKINKNNYWAFWIKDKGAGKIEDNDLRCNTNGAWSISEDSEPLVRRARNLEK
jgi:parallel beta-helix repeat (two copies)/parallel beta-helix repeat (two copies)